MITRISQEQGILSHGTFLQGYLKTSYSELVDRFGKPDEGFDDRILHEWWLTTPVGEVAIYDWRIPCEESEQAYSFHVAAKNNEVLSYLGEIGQTRLFKL
jgi:hypothetical protein